MSVYEFRDYKAYLDFWLKQHPKGGRGQMSKMAEHLRVSTTMLSQILRADKHFGLETAAEVADYLGLNEKESEYFILMVEHQRAGGFKLRNILERRLNREQQDHAQLKNRLEYERKLSDAEMMQFYSSWMYTGTRILSALPQIRNAQDVAFHLNLPIAIVNSVVNFLLEKGFCRLDDGILTYGNFSTFVEKTSPFAVKHLQNWRLKGFQAMELRREEDLFFSQPMAMSAEAALKIRQLIPGILEQIHAISDPSDSEVVRCLGIDWFEY